MSCRETPGGSATISLARAVNPTWSDSDAQSCFHAIKRDNEDAPAPSADEVREHVGAQFRALNRTDLSPSRKASIAKRLRGALANPEAYDGPTFAAMTGTIARANAEVAGSAVGMSPNNCPNCGQFVPRNGHLCSPGTEDAGPTTTANSSAANLTAEDRAAGYSECVNGCGEVANPSSDECMQCRHQPYGTEYQIEDAQRRGIEPDPVSSGAQATGDAGNFGPDESREDVPVDGESASGGEPTEVDRESGTSLQMIAAPDGIRRADPAEYGLAPFAEQGQVPPDDTDPNNRIYRSAHTDHEYDSVTTVNGVVNRPWLNAWKEREAIATTLQDPARYSQIAEEAGSMRAAAEAVWADRDAHNAASVGTEVHSWMEAVGKGEPTPAISADAAEFIPAAKNFFAEKDVEFIATEITIFNDDDKVAGTMDAIVRYKGEVLAIDWKTQSGDSLSCKDDMLLQQGGLARGTRWETASGATGPMPQMDGAAIVLIGKEGRFRMTRVVDLEGEKAGFGQHLALFRRNSSVRGRNATM